jgi:hypothetical protein
VPAASNARRWAPPGRPRGQAASRGSAASIRPLTRLSWRRMRRWRHAAAAFTGLVHSVKAGIGIGPLPLPIGDAEPDLVRVLGPVPE